MDQKRMIGLLPQTRVKGVGRQQQQGGRLVEIPRRTWLENVEAEKTELEIDKEDVHDRQKWRGNVTKRKSNPIGKWTINR